MNIVFGDYVDVKIDKDGFIYDENSFVFLLIKDGNLKNRKYSINPFYSEYAFYLWNNNQYGCLCRFSDLSVHRIGDNKSWCKCGFYNNNDEQNSLIDNTIHSTKFEAKRIIVIEMN